MDPLAEITEDPLTALEPLSAVHAAAGPYLSTLDDRPAQEPSSLPLLDRLDGDLPEHGEGARSAIERLVEVGTAAATHSSGPHFYHFVIGGSTPAAMAGDWLTSLLDQNAAMRASSAFATKAEDVTLRWLVDLFGLPPSWGGALVASATYANFTGLGAATHWWAEQYGVDYADAGLAGLPRMPVLSSGYVHASARKALQMLGHGKNTVEVYARDGAGRLDRDAMAARLRELDGSAIIIGNAGDVNTGDFDPIADLADLAAEHGAWLHIDGAFGAFAALSPRTAHLMAGAERAQSIAADAHKWLNVPYESGFAFLAEPERLGHAFGMPGAAYFPDASGAGAGYMMLGPESSRRARALPIWATLAAYGRDGYRALIERHVDLAQRLATLVDQADDMERLADVPLCIVCFRYRPEGAAEAELDDLNRRLGAAILADGRVYAGTTVYDGKVALRPAITNWRVTERDVVQFVEVVRELGRALVDGAPR
ncbi:MAG TPA: pyridoxal-dependent decarboxylase [Micromonosporaceae bacterium]